MLEVERSEALEGLRRAYNPANAEATHGNVAVVNGALEVLDKLIGFEPESEDGDDDTD
jgi:hypothetical protein